MIFRNPLGNFYELGRSFLKGILETFFNKKAFISKKRVKLRPDLDKNNEHFNILHKFFIS